MGVKLGRSHSGRVLDNRVLRRIFGPKMGEVIGGGENYIMRSLIICTPHPILYIRVTK